MVKTCVSILCLFYLLFKIPNFTKAALFGFLYLLSMYFCAFLHPESLRYSTLLYSASLVITYICFYNLVWVKQVFTLTRFIRILRIFIFIYVSVLIVQQFFIIVGIKYYPLINLCQVLNRGLGANSLSGEPSSFGRILTVLMYAYIKCSEYLQGKPIIISEMINKNNRWVSYAYLYAIFTMGSVTAFLCLAILSLYFIRTKYLLIVIPLYIGVFYFMSHSENESFHRLTNAIEVTITGNTDELRITDSSAAIRINPMLNTINNLDLVSEDTWFGHGVDWSLRPEIKRSSQRMIGEIGDYGLITYLLGLLLVFNCSISFFSLGTIMFFLGVGGGTGNIAYGWGILMVFAVVKYFHDNLDIENIYDSDGGYEEDEITNVESLRNH